MADHDDGTVMSSFSIDSVATAGTLFFSEHPDLPHIDSFIKMSQNKYSKLKPGGKKNANLHSTLHGLGGRAAAEIPIPTRIQFSIQKQQVDVGDLDDMSVGSSSSVIPNPNDVYRTAYNVLYGDDNNNNNKADYPGGGGKRIKKKKSKGQNMPHNNIHHKDTDNFKENEIDRHEMKVLFNFIDACGDSNGLITLDEVEIAFRKYHHAKDHLHEEDEARALMLELEQMLFALGLTPLAWWDTFQYKVTIPEHQHSHSDLHQESQALGRSRTHSLSLLAGQSQGYGNSETEIYGYEHISRVGLRKEVLDVQKKLEVDPWDQQKLQVLLRYLDPSTDDKLEKFELARAFKRVHVPVEAAVIMKLAGRPLGMLDEYINLHKLRIRDVYQLLSGTSIAGHGQQVISEFNYDTLVKGFESAMERLWQTKAARRERAILERELQQLSSLVSPMSTSTRRFKRIPQYAVPQYVLDSRERRRKAKSRFKTTLAPMDQVATMKRDYKEERRLVSDMHFKPKYGKNGHLHPLSVTGLERTDYNIHVNSNGGEPELGGRPPSPSTSLVVEKATARKFLLKQNAKHQLHLRVVDRQLMAGLRALADM